MVDDNLEAGDKEVGRLMDSHQFVEARQRCEAMLLSARPINQAVLLSNIMTCFMNEGNVEKALQAGEQAIQVIDVHRLKWLRGPDGDKAAAIRGYVRGGLARIRGQSSDGRGPNMSLSSQGLFWGAYFGAAAIGAVVGTNLRFGYDPGNPTPLWLRCPDARYLLAPVVGFLGHRMVHSLFQATPRPLAAVLGISAAATLALLFKDLVMPQPFIAIAAVIVPMVAVTLLAVTKSAAMGRPVR